MSWVSLLSLLVFLTVIGPGHGQENETSHGKVESTSSNCEKVDLNHNLLVDILCQLTAFRKDIDDLKVDIGNLKVLVTTQQSEGQVLKQTIVNSKVELSAAMNQSLDKMKNEILSFAQEQVESICQEPENTEDTFVLPKSTDQMLLLVGGVRTINGSFFRINETTALYNGTWIRKSPLPDNVSGLTVSQLPSGDLIAVGGLEPSSYSNKTFIYHVDADRWENGPSMNMWRYEHCSVTLGSKIYAIGGSNGIDTLKTMEVCDTGKGDSKCEYLSPMATPRYAPRAVIYNGELYVTGGPYLSSCEKYDFQLDKWGPIPDMIHNRHRHGLVTFNSKIYAIGGVSTHINNTGEVLKSVESFNGHEWVEEPSLNVARFVPAVGVIGQNIYVVGGNDQYIVKDGEWQYNPVSSVEIFDPDTSQWRFVNITGTSPLPITHSSAVVVDLN